MSPRCNAPGRPLNATSNHVSPVNAPLMAQGVDVSRRAGAYRLGQAIRLYWLRKGWDVPVQLRETVIEPGGKGGKSPDHATVIFGPQADFTAARRLNAVEQAMSEFELVNELDGEEVE